MFSFEELFSFDNLYKAHCKARLCKRNKKQVVEFELNTGANLIKLQKEILSNNYKIDKYNTFYIYEPKERRVDALPYVDRIVQHVVCDNYLMPYLEKRLIYDNAACRIGKGTDFARKRLKHFYTEYFRQHTNKGYVLKCDIHHFFQSIDHNVLKEIIKRDFKEEKILKLLNSIIDSYELEPNKGLPIGNQTSQAFAIRYLDEMDRIIKEKFKIKYYTRYMDDFLLISNNKEELKVILEYLRKFLNEKYKLSINPKTRIYKLNEFVEYLGFKFRLLDTGKVLMKITAKKKRKYKKRIQEKYELQKKYKDKKEEFIATLVSYVGHIRKGDEFYYLKRVIKGLR